MGDVDVKWAWLRWSVVFKTSQDRKCWSEIAFIRITVSGPLNPVTSLELRSVMRTCVCVRERYRERELQKPFH